MANWVAQKKEKGKTGPQDRRGKTEGKKKSVGKKKEKLFPGRAGCSKKLCFEGKKRLWTRRRKLGIKKKKGRGKRSVPEKKERTSTLVRRMKRNALSVQDSKRKRMFAVC